MIAPGLIARMAQQPIGAVQAKIGLEEQPLSRRLVLALKYPVTVIDYIPEDQHAPRLLNAASAEFLRPPDVGDCIDVPDCITHAVITIFVLECIVVCVRSDNETHISLTLCFTSD